MDSDEWLFDSVKNYENLFMYDLQHPVTCMDWVDDKNLVVATSSSDKNEIIELSVPDKLLSDVDETADLSKDRDFHQTNGGFSSCQICCIKHIPQTRHVCTSSKTEPGIQVWKLGGKETDLITSLSQYTCSNGRKSDTRHFAKIAVNNGSCVVFGSCFNNLSCLDVGNQKITDLTQGSENMCTNYTSEIKFMDENTVILCSENTGEVILLDIRSNKQDLSKIANKQDSNKNLYWTMDVTSDILYRLSSDGHIIISDIRNGANNILKKIETDFRSKTNQTGVCIKASPQQKNTVSISGFDGNIYVYETMKEPITESGYTFTEPIFKHEGHVKNCSDQSDDVNTVAHLWHPWKPDLLISSGTDGSLHAWEYSLPGS